MDRHSQAREFGAIFAFAFHAFLLEVKQYWRNRSDALKALGLSLQIILLFALLYGPAAEQLGPLASGACLLAVILAINFNAEQFLAEEARSGALEQWLFYSVSPYFLALAKIVAFWLASVAPLLLILPLFTLLLAGSSAEMWLLIQALLLISPTLCCLAALAAALSLSLSNRVFFIQLIAMPLSIPLLIFALQIINDPSNISFYLLTLASILLLALALAPALLLAILRATLR